MGDIHTTVWEVFGQKARGEAHVHAGSMLAPDDSAMALVLARENFARRQEYVNLWVVRRDHLHSTPPDVDLSQPVTDKTYRMGVGYRDTVRKWRRFRAAAGPAGGGGTP